jgi:hypothetical protein
MKQQDPYKKDRDKMELLLALGLFHKEGMRAVERMFPQHKAFVEAYKDQPFEDVKDRLLHDTLIAA